MYLNFFASSLSRLKEHSSNAGPLLNSCTYNDNILLEIFSKSHKESFQMFLKLLVSRWLIDN